MVEGINNKIKVMKRGAYGFTDHRYFMLRLLALHNAGITSFLCIVERMARVVSGLTM